MKAVFTLFLLLCCYLSGSCSYARSSSHASGSGLVHAAGAQQEKVERLAAMPVYMITGEGGLPQGNPDLLCIEDEDEPDEYMLKKTASRYNSGFYRVYVSGRHTVPFGRLFSCRYRFCTNASKGISQRVLRI